MSVYSIERLSTLPKAGRYDYPVKDLDTCILLLRKGHDKMRSFSMTRDTFASALEMSPKTGPFGLIVGSMVYYGLVTTGDGYVRYTDNAKTILFGEPNEVAKAKKDAVSRIQLFNDIHARYGSTITEEQLRLFLREAGGVELQDASAHAGLVSKIYNKVSSYLDYSYVQKESSTEGDEDNTIEKIVEYAPDVLEFEHYKLGEGISLTLPKDKNLATQAWERTKNAMDIILGINQDSRSSNKKSDKDKQKEEKEQSEGIMSRLSGATA